MPLSSRHRRSCLVFSFSFVVAVYGAQLLGGALCWQRPRRRRRACPLPLSVSSHDQTGRVSSALSCTVSFHAYCTFCSTQTNDNNKSCIAADCTGLTFDYTASSPVSLSVRWPSLQLLLMFRPSMSSSLLLEDHQAVDDARRPGRNVRGRARESSLPCSLFPTLCCFMQSSLMGKGLFRQEDTQQSESTRRR